MNTIGSAATSTTAATNNTYSTQALANLSSLASNFTSSTSSASGLNFNNLILSLLMQVIQTLLKNMQNKNCCCDQPSKPQALNLTDTEKTKLADALSTDGKAVTIVSVEDSDKSGQLSVGDKVNIQRPTGKLDDQGKPIVESASVKLTQEQLDRYQNTSSSFNKLSLSTAEQDKLLDVVTLGRYYIGGNVPRLVNVIDKDNSGSLSIGDQINLKSFFGRHDEITNEPIITYSTETFSAEQFNNYQNLTKDGNLLDLSSQERGWLQTTYHNSLPTVLNVVYDNDNSGDISVGDSIGLRQYVGLGAPTLEAPYQVSLVTLDQQQFDEYLKAKATGGGTKGDRIS